jgi:hypothetical protein
MSMRILVTVLSFLTIPLVMVVLALGVVVLFKLFS